MTNSSSADQRLTGKNAFVAALLIALSAAFLLAGYEFLRSPMNTYFKEVFGKEALPFAMTALPFCVLALIYVYGKTLTSFGPRKTLVITTLASAGAIAGSYALMKAGYKEVIAFLYVFGASYVVLVIEQYWSFINSVISEKDCKKLNGPIAGCASIGAILAGSSGAQLVSEYGAMSMFLFAAAATVPAALFSDIAYNKYGSKVVGEHQKSEDKKVSVSSMGLDLFKREKILGVLICVIVVTQLVSTMLSLSFQGILQDQIPDVVEQTSYSYTFFSYINMASAVGQFLAAPLLMMVLSPAIIQCLIPIIHIVACGLFLYHGDLIYVAAALLIFKTVDYSVFRATKEIFYIPLSYGARYRAKEVVDVFGYRFGKGGAAALVSVLQKMGIAMTESFYALGALAGAFAWILLMVPIVKGVKNND